jgi:hypothetical protein
MRKGHPNSQDGNYGMTFKHTQIQQDMKSHWSESKEVLMFLAIAVENKQHPRHQQEYRVWFLEIDSSGQVVGVGVKTKTEMVENLFENYRRTGKSNWRAFQKGADKSTPVEMFDFISMNMHENTHFGTLPSLSEFQAVLDTLQSRLELRSIA